MFSSQRKESAYELVTARKKKRSEHTHSLWESSLSMEAAVDPLSSLFLLPVGHWVDTVSGP